MAIMLTILSILTVTLGAIITIKGKPLEFNIPKWIEWLQRLVNK